MTGKGEGERGRVGSLLGTSLLVQVQPRARTTEITGWYGEAVKIRVAAPPVNGAANDELVRFLAQRLGVARSRVRLAAGAAGRRKRIEVLGLGADEVRARLGIGPV